jgi:hypothetical protein
VNQVSGPLRPTYDLLYAQAFFPALPGLFLRGGVLESSGSIGFDYRLFKDWVGVQGDAYRLGAYGRGRAGLFLRPGPLRVGALLDGIGAPDARNIRVGLGVELHDPDLRYVIGLLGLSSTMYK